MKRVIGLVIICGAASCVSGAAEAATKTAAAKQAAVLQLAPADEYFGPLKMSILGIRNTIHDLGARYDVNHDIGHQTYSSAQLTEKAIHDWEHRYPHDGLVPKAIYLLQRLYTKVLTQEARDRAKVTAKWMFADYSSSPQGKQLKKTLAVEHLAPLPTPTATANPLVTAPPVLPDASAAPVVPAASTAPASTTSASVAAPATGDAAH